MVHVNVRNIQRISYTAWIETNKEGNKTRNKDEAVSKHCFGLEDGGDILNTGWHGIIFQKIEFLSFSFNYSLIAKYWLSEQERY